MTDRSVILLGSVHDHDPVLPLRVGEAARDLIPGQRARHERTAIMKAAVIGTLATPPRVTTHPDPSPATGDQVLVKVEATALNVIDLHVAAGGHRAGPPHLPYVPGLEAAGTIVAGPDQGLRVRAVAPAGLVPGVNGGLAELLLASRAKASWFWERPVPWARPFSSSPD
jgi:NADPH:quinone reductase-like Zn-dependent oxidoreductase